MPLPLGARAPKGTVITTDEVRFGNGLDQRRLRRKKSRVIPAHSSASTPAVT